MDDFLENIINYLQERVNADTFFTANKKPLVCEAYGVNHNLTASQPEIQVQIIDFREQSNYTTFCGKRASAIPLQFSAYAGQISKKNDAQHYSIKMAEKVIKYIDELVYGEQDKYGISTATHISSTIGLPMNDGGTIYASVVRYNFVVQ